MLGPGVSLKTDCFLLPRASGGQNDVKGKRAA